MKPETGTVFLILAVSGAIIWYAIRMKAQKPDNVVTTDAGQVVPETAVSNSPDIEGNDWGTPYYLRYNFPTDRTLGSLVIPSYVRDALPSFFGSQEIPPQL